MDRQSSCCFEHKWLPEHMLDFHNLRHNMLSCFYNIKLIKTINREKKLPKDQSPISVNSHVTNQVAAGAGQDHDNTACTSGIELVFLS